MTSYLLSNSLLEHYPLDENTNRKCHCQCHSIIQDTRLLFTSAPTSCDFILNYYKLVIDLCTLVIWIVNSISFKDINGFLNAWPKTICVWLVFVGIWFNYFFIISVSTLHFETNYQFNIVYIIWIMNIHVNAFPKSIFVKNQKHSTANASKIINAMDFYCGSDELTEIA